MKNKIESFKGREVDMSLPVKVYRNLHKKEKVVWSIKQGGLVVGHATDLLLHSCKFKVSEAGRKRVREEKIRNVHAYCVGYVAHKEPTEHTFWLPIRYNPYKDDGFMCQILNKSWRFFGEASYARFSDRPTISQWIRIDEDC